MCGIVGYCGPADPKQIIVDGLKRLEYRGYDSSGIAVLDGGKFKIVRAEGKLTELQKKLEKEKFNGHLGIGHTRWATHGVPSERNAHPHTVNGVSLVHNGIIENYRSIRDQLEKDGANISSDTDSELVAHLVARTVQQTGDLFAAVKLVIPQLRGAYSILVVWENQPEVMVAFKNGPPLILGVGKGEMIVASDIQAIIQHTKDVLHLEDDEILKVNGQSWSVFSFEGQKLEKKLMTVKWSAAQAERSGYKHFMLKEIFEQPRAVAASIGPHIDIKTNSVRLHEVGFDVEKEFKRIERVFFVACGTSFYAAMIGEYMLESLAGIPVEIDVASEFRYRDPVIPQNSLFVVISQSGETADTLAALRLAKEAGALTLSICNVPGSTIDREAHGRIYMNSGPEIAVASTKALTSTMAILQLLTLQMAKIRSKIKAPDEETHIKNLQAVPSQMESVLAYDRFFAEAAKRIAKFRMLLYMGRGVSYPLAMEGALKLKELAYFHAEGYAAGEMKHGPLALIDKDMLIVMCAPSDQFYEKTISNLEEARARGGKIISIGTGDNMDLKKISDDYISIPQADWTLNPLLAVIPMQLLAYHVADSLGLDVDQPRNLAKSVTVE